MFADVAELESALATPSDGLVDDLTSGSGDLVVLGAGGKMGPTLCLLARRAMDAAGRASDAVWAVSRWSDRETAQRLSDAHISVVAADLLRDDSLDPLPDGSDVVFMVGAKFGASSDPSLTWAVNAALPDRVARRYPTARIAVMSTGNVYPFVTPGTGGCRESEPPQPVGEYAMSCLGRERAFEFAARDRGTSIAIVRLNYAIDLRYGVLADIGVQLGSGQPIDITTSSVNVVWQGYANEALLRSLAHASTPPFVLNVTGPETASVVALATALAERMNLPVNTFGEASPTALLSNAGKCHSLFGYPTVSLDNLIDWQAQWLQGGLPLLSKPTKFAVRDGKF